MDLQNWSRKPIIAVMEMVDLVADLLYKHNCVIVPGLGGFVSNYSGSEFKEDFLTLIPARKRIAFNEQLHENDGLLINHVARTFKISYSEAESQVQRFVEFVSERIHSHKSFEFRNVGTFYYTRENKVVFVPYEGLNMLAGSYGLSPVKIRSNKKSGINSNTENVPVIPSDGKVKKIKQNRNRSFEVKKLWPYVSGAAVILFLAVSVQFLSQVDFDKIGLPGKDVKKQQDASLLKFDTQEKAPIVQPESEIIPEKVEQKEKIQEEKQPEITRPEPAVPAPAPEKPNPVAKNEETTETQSGTPDWLEAWKKNRNKTEYYIVIDQADSEDKLNSRLQSLLESGFAAGIIKHENRHYLSIEHFANEKNATEYLRLIKRSYNKATIIPIAS